MILQETYPLAGGVNIPKPGLDTMSGTVNRRSGKRFSGSDAEKTVADWAKGLFAGVR